MIKKHFKKLVSVALSAVMVMGMSVTAFAAENQTSTDLQSAYNNIVKYAETNNIDLSMDYQEFINSYNGSSVQAYEQSYYSILAPVWGFFLSNIDGVTSYYKGIVSIQC